MANLWFRSVMCMSERLSFFLLQYFCNVFHFSLFSNKHESVMWLYCHQINADGCNLECLSVLKSLKIFIPIYRVTHKVKTKCVSVNWTRWLKTVKRTKTLQHQGLKDKQRSHSVPPLLGFCYRTIILCVYTLAQSKACRQATTEASQHNMVDGRDFTHFTHTPL